MRHMAAMGYLIETAPDQYKPTNFSRSLSLPVIGHGYPCMSFLMTAQSKFPEYAKATNYKTPNQVDSGPLQYAFNTQLNMFEYLTAHSSFGMQFNNHMGGYHQGRPSWMDQGFYPVEERLIHGAQTDQDATFLVDIAGGVGHDLEEFLRKVPHAPGRLVLQDLEAVIDQAHGLGDRIHKMVYDFYTEQPIKGESLYALMYFSGIADKTRCSCVLYALHAARLA